MLPDDPDDSACPGICGIGNCGVHDDECVEVRRGVALPIESRLLGGTTPMSGLEGMSRCGCGRRRPLSLSAMGFAGQVGVAVRRSGQGLLDPLAGTARAGTASYRSSPFPSDATRCPMRKALTKRNLVLRD